MKCLSVQPPTMILLYTFRNFGSVRSLSWKMKNIKAKTDTTWNDFLNQSGCEPLSSYNDLWKAENGVFVLIK